MLDSHVKGVHFKLKSNQCTVCERLFAKMENLDIHIAVTHLGYTNDKEWKAVRKENKHLTAPYKAVIPYTIQTFTEPEIQAATVEQEEQFIMTS